MAYLYGLPLSLFEARGLPLHEACVSVDFVIHLIRSPPLHNVLLRRYRSPIQSGFPRQNVVVAERRGGGEMNRADTEEHSGWIAIDAGATGVSPANRPSRAF